jgi:hypothetical protein
LGQCPTNSPRSLLNSPDPDAHYRAHHLSLAQRRGLAPTFEVLVRPTRNSSARSTSSSRSGCRRKLASPTHATCFMQGQPHRRLQAVEPTVVGLDHPLSGLLVRVALLDVGFRATANDVGDVAVVRDGAKVLGSTVTPRRAQMLVSPVFRILSLRTMALSTSPGRLQLGELAPVTTSDNGTPRPSIDRLENLSSRLRRPGPWLAQVGLVCRRARGDQRLRALPELISHRRRLDTFRQDFDPAPRHIRLGSVVHLFTDTFQLGRKALPLTVTAFTVHWSH